VAEVVPAYRAAVVVGGGDVQTGELEVALGALPRRLVPSARRLGLATVVAALGGKDRPWEVVGHQVGRISSQARAASSARPKSSMRRVLPFLGGVSVLFFGPP